MNKIIFATANPHKVEEISRINRSISFLSLTDVGITEDIPETGDTFRENAFQKANYVFEQTNMPVLSEDSGLVIDALDGRPGVLSARFAGTNKNHQHNIEKVLSLLRDKSDRRAHFSSTLCFINSQKQVYYFEGICPGKIHSEIMGTGGFGYDPIFIPEGFEKTFGILDDSIKDKISHRKKSFAIFSEFLDAEKR